MSVKVTGKLHVGAAIQLKVLDIGVTKLTRRHYVVVEVVGGEKPPIVQRMYAGDVTDINLDLDVTT